MLIDLHAHMHHFDEAETTEIISHPDCPGIIVNSVHTNEQLNHGLNLQTIENFCAGNQKNRFLVSAGVHPQIADYKNKECLDFLESIEDNIKNICAVGEVGYDLYDKNPSLGSQRYIFLKEIELAQKYNLPLIIHCRNAFEILLEDLKQVDIPVIFHGYSGGFKYLDEIVKKGYYISFGTPLTYEQSNKLRRIAQVVPLNQIFTETDSPFNLTRHSNFEMEKNKPYYLRKIIEVLSEVKNISQDDLFFALKQNGECISLINNAIK